MALSISTTLENIRTVYDSAESWANAGGDASHYELLIQCEAQKRPVVIECEASDGCFDILLPNGTIVEAISYYHLEGFTANGIDFGVL